MIGLGSDRNTETFKFSPVRLLRISCNSTKPESPTKTRPTIVVTHITTFQGLIYHNLNYFQNFSHHSTPSSSLYNVHLNNKWSNLKRSPSFWRGRATPRFCVQGDVEANHLQMCPPSQIFKCVQWTLLTLISVCFHRVQHNILLLFSTAESGLDWCSFRETSPDIAKSLDLV